jgi:hypothetical protein
MLAKRGGCWSGDGTKYTSNKHWPPRKLHTIHATTRFRQARPGDDTLRPEGTNSQGEEIAQFILPSVASCWSTCSSDEDALRLERRLVALRCLRRLRRIVSEGVAERVGVRYKPVLYGTPHHHAATSLGLSAVRVGSYGCAACRIRVSNGACGWWCIPPRRGQGQARSQERAEQSFRDGGKKACLAGGNGRMLFICIEHGLGVAVHPLLPMETQSTDTCRRGGRPKSVPAPTGRAPQSTSAASSTQRRGSLAWLCCGARDILAVHLRSLYSTGN